MIMESLSFFLTMGWLSLCNPPYNIQYLNLRCTIEIHISNFRCYRTGRFHPLLCRGRSHHHLCVRPSVRSSRHHHFPWYVPFVILYPFVCFLLSFFFFFYLAFCVNLHHTKSPKHLNTPTDGKAEKIQVLAIYII